MIRPLSETDRGRTTELLEQAPEYNLYVLGNLASVGFDQSELSQFWGDFDDTGHLRAVLNRYMTGWVAYGEADSEWSALGRVIDEHPVEAQRLQDNPGGITTLLPYITKYTADKVSIQTLMALDDGAFKPTKSRQDVVIRRATLDDLPALTEFYAQAGHMSRTASGIEQPIRRTRLWLAERNGEICSAALTNAETTKIAMIGGVYTPSAHRSNGYSQAVCSALCEELLVNQIRPVLYWETPAAGAVYTRLGFHELGSWRSVRFQLSNHLLH